MDRYAVIGNPVAHSKSPLIHAAFARATGESLCYERILAPREGFDDALVRFVDEGGKGLNVTLPFKELAFGLATELSERAEAAAACNTLAWRGDHWFGDNTDGAGLMRDLEVNLRWPIAARSVLVIGAGGAARGILGPLLDAAPAELVLANRTHARAMNLAHRFASRGAVALPLAALADRSFDLVINATSAALASGTCASAWPELRRGVGTHAYDLVYGAAAAPFARWARAQGATAISDGLGMLVEQAAESFFVWRGLRPDTAPVLRDLRAL